MPTRRLTALEQIGRRIALGLGLVLFITLVVTIQRKGYTDGADDTVDPTLEETREQPLHRVRLRLHRTQRDQSVARSGSRDREDRRHRAECGNPRRGNNEWSRRDPRRRVPDRHAAGGWYCQRKGSDRHHQPRRRGSARDAHGSRAQPERRHRGNLHLLTQSGADSVIHSADAVGRLLGLATTSEPVAHVLDDLLMPGSGLDVIEVAPVQLADGTWGAPDNERTLALLRDGAHLSASEAGPVRPGDRLVVLHPNPH